MAKHIVVAIDGPAGAGKSTLADRLATKLGFLKIDTGAMYRAVALWALRLQVDLTDSARLEQLAQNAVIVLERNGNVLLNDEDVSAAIRDPEVTDAASRVAAVGGVRRALVIKQQLLGQSNSIVMEGRDIGTVVFPDAAVKIFLDATVEERARRRTEELRENGQPADETEICQRIRERDERDRTRGDAPLRQAPDAIVVDSNGRSLEEVEDEVLRIIRARTSNGKEVHR